MGLSRLLGLGVLTVVAVLLTACAGTESGTLTPGGGEATGTDIEHPGPGDSGVNSPECVWAQSDSGHNTVAIAGSPPNENGLNDIYAQRDEMSYFEPTEINGYPAVFAAQFGKPSDYGECVLHFGVTDELSARAFAQMDREPETDDPCSTMQEIVEPMIDTLQG